MWKDFNMERAGMNFKKAATYPKLSSRSVILVGLLIYCLVMSENVEGSMQNLAELSTESFLSSAFDSVTSKFYNSLSFSIDFFSRHCDIWKKQDLFWLDGMSLFYFDLIAESFLSLRIFS
jgi:hypothetical protein